MCLLIQQPKSREVSREKLKTAFENNPDGAGFSYAHNGRVHVEKFRKFKPFYKRYKKAVSVVGKTSDFIVHFRLTTHGTNKGTFNVHPFKVTDELAFAHNGIINGVGTSKKLSDTRLFNKRILQNLPKGFIYNDIVRELLGDKIGHSKLGFVDGKGDSFLVNEKLGHHDEEGVWFSNESYIEDDWSCYGFGGYYPRGYTRTAYKGGKLVDNTKESKKSASSCAPSSLQTCDWCRCNTDDIRGVFVYGSTSELCGTCSAYAVE